MSIYRGYRALLSDVQVRQVLDKPSAALPSFESSPAHLRRAQPVLVLLPPIVDPVDPAVCAPAQAKAVSKTGAANHVRFIDHPRVIWWKFRASLPISETQSS